MSYRADSRAKSPAPWSPDAEDRRTGSLTGTHRGGSKKGGASKEEQDALFCLCLYGRVRPEEMLGWMTGLEPATSWATTRRSTN